MPPCNLLVFDPAVSQTRQREKYRAEEFGAERRREPGMLPAESFAGCGLRQRSFIPPAQTTRNKTNRCERRETKS